MKICELIELMPEHDVPPKVDRTKELIPTVSPERITEDSILFIYKRINGEYNINPHEIEPHPYVVVTDKSLKLAWDAHIIRTENVRKSLSYAFYLESGFDPGVTKLIAVTGTNGKTTTSTIIERVLNRIGIKCGYIGTGIMKSGDEILSTENYSMTTPDPDILFGKMREMQKRGCEVIVMEVSSHSIALEKIVPLIFNIAVFTNLSSEHLDFHKDMESYYQTKMRLFRQCKLGIFNIDDEYGARGYKEATCKKRSLGIIERGDSYCTDIEYIGLDGSQYYYRDEKRIFKITTSLPGCFNIYNSAIAMSALIELGVPVSRGKSELSIISSICGRLEVIHTYPTVIIDYAHTPLAIENALKVIASQLILGQRLFVVFGCGGDRDKSKRSLMGSVASKYADIIYLTEDNSRSESTKSIIDDILSGITHREKVYTILSRREAIIAALSEARENDVVAIIGKGHERYIIDKNGYRSFSEPEIIKSFYEVGKDTNAN